MSDDLTRLLEIEVLESRIEDAVSLLDKLADLLADSEGVPVNHTPAVERINEVLEILGGEPRGERPCRTT